MNSLIPGRQWLTALCLALFVLCSLTCGAGMEAAAKAAHDCCPKQEGDHHPSGGSGSSKACSQNAVDVPKSPLGDGALLATPAAIAGAARATAVSDDVAVSFVFSSEDLHLRNRVLRI